MFYNLSREYKKPVAVLFPYSWVISFYKKLGFKKIPKSLASYKRLSKKEKALARELKNEYLRYLKKNPWAVMFSKWSRVMSKSRRLLKK